MEIRHEELSDLPLIAHFIKSSGIVEMLDKHYPVHGNWTAPSFGNMVLGWLVYIISECDHTLYSVQDWATRHSGVLGHIMGCNLYDGHCFHDDRLGLLLEHFSDLERFGEFMEEYNQGLVVLYELPKCVVRVDSFNVPSYREDEGAGLFRHGYKKSHQAQEPHLKVMAACLDPLALPIATVTAPGSICDDDLYFPVIERARRGLNQAGLLYVGDTKMGSAFVCGKLFKGGDFYLCPLSNAFLPRNSLMEYIKMATEAPQEQVQTLYKETPNGRQELTDRIFELPAVQRQQPEEGLSWTERRIMVYSLPYANSQEKKIREKVDKAKKEIEERFEPKKYRKKWMGGQEDKARTFIDSVTARHGIAPFLSISLTASSKHPIQVSVEVDEAAICQKIQTMGWRVYITNSSAEQLNAKQVLTTYRNQYLIEHQFHKILTKTTGLLPINLKKDNRCTALINLIVLALQFISIIQYRAKKEIENIKKPLTGVVPGNKTRKISNPTAELLLKRFKGINAVCVKMPDGSNIIQLFLFDTVHVDILNFLGCPQDLYMIYAKNSFP